MADQVGFDLCRALTPIGLDVFFGEYYEKTPLHIRGRPPGYYDGLFSFEDAERMLSRLRPDEFRLVNKGVVEGKAVRVLDGFAYLSDVLDRMAGGSTLILERIHERSADVGEFCRRLEKQFGFPVRANAYLTPKSSQGFSPHFDTHDVFVLQTVGVKRWKVYGSPTRLPLRSQQSYVLPASGLGTPALETDLSPGDCLYLPRGFIHEGFTSGDVSLHVSVGLHGYTWKDLLIEAINTLGHTLPELRETVPRPPACNEVWQNGWNERLALAMHSAQEVTFIRSLTAAVRRDFVGTRQPLGASMLRSVLRCSPISEDTPVRLPGSCIYEITEDDHGVAIEFAGKRIVLPIELAIGIASVERSDMPFTAASLPSQLSGESKLLLVTCLVNAGFLEVCSPDGFA